MNKLIAIVCLLSCSTSYASPPIPDNIVLKQGDPAPYAGVLLPPERAKTLNDKVIDLDTCTKVSLAKEQEISIITDRLKNSQNEEDRLAKKVADSDSFWVKTGYFVLGAALTGLVAYGTTKALR